MLSILENSFRNDPPPPHALPATTCPEAGLALDHELTLTLLTVTQKVRERKKKAEPAKGLQKIHLADDSITASGVTQSWEGARR